MGASFLGGYARKPGRGLKCRGAYVKKKVLGRVSFHIGAILWDLWSVSFYWEL